MRSLTHLATLVLLAACGGGTYKQGLDDTALETEDGGSGDGGSTTEDGGSGDGGSGDGADGASDDGTSDGGPGSGGTDGTSDDGGTDSADGGADGADGGGSDGGGSDGGGSSTCGHDWYPVDSSGWTKTFYATFGTSEGTATEQGMGANPDAEGTFLVRDAMETTGNGYDTTVVVGCNTDGEGLFVLEYQGDFTYVSESLGFPVEGTVEASLSPYRKFLPADYAVGSTGSWSYSYTSTQNAMMDTGAFPITNTVTGTYNEIGIEDYRLPDGTTVQAYHLTNTYSITDSLGTTHTGTFEQWWVKGLGLVKEIGTDDADGSSVITKVLQSYSGLTPE